MRQLILANLQHVLCGLLLVARIGDVGSTYLVTPTLKLEGNLLAKKLGWRFALLTILVCFVPYYDVTLGMVILVPSLFVSASNIGRIWMVRAMGENEFAELLLTMARRTKLRTAICGVVGASAFVILAGAVLCFLAPNPSRDWGFWFGYGIILYGAVILVHGSLSYWRLFKKARALETPPPPA